MSEPKVTAEERWAATTARCRMLRVEPGEQHLYRAMEEHAAAAVKELEARVAELERERDEARMRSTQLRCELAQALKCIAALKESIDEEAV